MQQYLELGQTILSNGQTMNDRTGTGTLSVFRPKTMTFDLSQSFPLLTAKKMPFKGIVRELEWFIKGQDQIDSLNSGIKDWWAPWANEQGELPFMYYHQLMVAGGGQLKELISSIKDTPSSRRHVITTWNAETVKQQPLACCHGTVIQAYCRGEYLDIATYQRSADYFLGLPINIASYSILSMVIAKLVGMKPGILYYDLGDAHIYQNHIEQVKEMISRPHIEQPKLEISDMDKLEDFSLDKLTLIGYSHHNAIKGKMSV